MLSSLVRSPKDIPAVPDRRNLAVIIDGAVVGDVTQDDHGQLTFTYRDSWRARPDATPLSLSMSLAKARHRHRVIDPFLRGLLPDNQTVLERWGQRYGVSANNPFALLLHVGEDVAGAAQFVRDDRLTESQEPGSIEAVTDDYIENRLKTLRHDRASWIDARGEFSLAGAQSKFALYRASDGSWGIPHGRKATTHIFKPPLPGLANQEVNEHLCLQAASRLGMTAARSEIMTFGDEHAIVLERYDRILRANGDVARVHQEDMCQALGVSPERKYQRNDDGPGAIALMNLFRDQQPRPVANSSVETLVRALAFNWVICGPDAHAKNYSLLLAGPQVRFAPLYDIASVVAYPTQFNMGRIMMAMSINGKYECGLVSGNDWHAFAKAAAIDPGQMLGWVREIVSHTPDAFADAVAGAPGWVRQLDMTTMLLNGLASTAKERAISLDLSSSSW
jgi:serine/threonine-protein kinase HipA